MQVSKEIKWEAAHRLVHNYPGNCAHLHGHSYKATIVMESTTDKLDQYGFVKDFNDFKGLRAWVDANWDHGTLVSSDDLQLLEWLQRGRQRYFIIADNPTAERIGKELFIKASQLLNDPQSRVIEVKINETSNSEAVITFNDFTGEEMQNFIPEVKPNYV